MQLVLKTADVLKASVLLEERGVKFYSEAAGKFKGDEKKLLLRLAEMEKGHASGFLKLLEAFENTSAPRDSEDQAEARDYLSALTSDRIINEECVILGSDDFAGIMNKAMLIEKNSVFFYTAVKEAMADKPLEKQLQKIIDEELGHYKMLNNALTAWKNRPVKK